MRFFEASIDIDAPLPAAWAVLADTASYPTWDSGVISVTGTPAQGNKIKVLSHVSPDRAFPVTVSTFDPEGRMVWTGGAPLGLFTGRRSFTLTEQGDGRCRLHVREEFSGPLLRLIWRKMPDLQPSFDQFVNGLAAEAVRHRTD